MIVRLRHQVSTSLEVALPLVFTTILAPVRLVMLELKDAEAGVVYMAVKGERGDIVDMLVEAGGARVESILMSRGGVRADGGQPRGGETTLIGREIVSRMLGVCKGGLLDRRNFWLY